ncbi:Carboxy-terminal domain (CTD) phosphatase [Thoreauomyces humboldtii]|nr:Carboxy-terminal domain (CTD) phosphatase [Thoreauomyces humboldtii]
MTTEAEQKVLLPAARYPITIISIRVKPNTEVQKDDVLGVYEYFGSVTTKKTTWIGDFQKVEEVVTPKNVREEWRSAFTGRVSKMFVNPGQVVTDPRGDYMGNDLGRATINMAHDNRGVTVSLRTAEKVDRDRSKRLLSEKKLVLFLDLDQTIVHATVDPTVAQWMNDPSNPNQQFLTDVHRFEIPTYHTHFVKLRPGTREFLAEMNELYEMHIYTMGSRQYADQIALILDPDRKLFKDRILSRDENRSNFKSIKRLFPSDQSMVVVVDDRSDVWHWSLNLYKILPFNFFAGTGDINALGLPPSGPPRTGPIVPLPKALLEAADGDEDKAEDDSVLSDDTQHQLLDDLEKSRPLERLSAEMAEETNPNSTTSSQPSSTQANRTDPATAEAKPDKPTGTVLGDDDREIERATEILKHVHASFYDHVGTEVDDLPDVSAIMEEQKRDVLSGVKIVFSGVIPSHLDPSKQDIWIGAEQFGAMCSVELSDDVTHVVTIQQNGPNRTTKVRRARNMPGVFVVKPDWLYDSISRWRHEEEDSYLLERVCRGTEALHVTTDRDVTLDADDEAIASGTWEQDHNVYNHLDRDDIAAMDEEIEAALADDSDDDDDDDDDAEGFTQGSDVDLEAMLDEEFDRALENDDEAERGAAGGGDSKRNYDDAGLDDSQTSSITGTEPPRKKPRSTTTTDVLTDDMETDAHTTLPPNSTPG